MKSILAMALTVALGSSVALGQKVDITPSPQMIEWGAKAFDRPTGLKIVGAKEADADAVALLRSLFPNNNGVKLVIGERGDKSVARYAAQIPDKEQGYYLKVSPSEVVVAGNDATGTFYGVQSLLALLATPEVMEVEIADWPATANRGVVEGFYGNAWSFDDRVSQFEFYGCHKLDTYIYGPKDDPYHRGKWRELYPEADAENIRQLVDVARRNKVKFVWGLHPAGDHSWQEDDNQAAVNKLEQLYSLGVRHFAVFFDDVFGVHADGKKHAEMMDYLLSHFVAKHPDVQGLIMCPSLYNKSWVPRFQSSYLEDISMMDPSIAIMWTGDKIVSDMTVEQLEWINSQIGRKAFVWHNYPVTDYCVDHLLMGPYTGNDPAVTALVSGFTSNPMEYAEASKVSLAGTAALLWNPEKYDADKVWELTMTELAPEHPDAFRTFCLYNIDLGPTAHKYRKRGESPALKSLIEANEANLLNGDASSVSDFEAEFASLESACVELLHDTTGNRLLAEIRPWIEATRLLGARGQVVVDMYRALSCGDDKSFSNAYLAYCYLTDKAGAITARDFEGTIKAAHPVAGTNFAEPFLRRSVDRMLTEYKTRSDYHTDLFPQLVLNNGTYIIKVDGKYLGNPLAGDAEAVPTLQTEIDDVNPDRQLWRFTYSPESKGYVIANVKDGRVLRNNGEFAEIGGTSGEFSFEITPTEGGYQLMTRWSGSPAYLSVNGDHLQRQNSRSRQAVFQIEKAKQ